MAMRLIASETKPNAVGIKRLVETYDCSGMTLKNVRASLRMNGYNAFWYDEEERSLLAEKTPNLKLTTVWFSEKGRALKPEGMEV